ALFRELIGPAGVVAALALTSIAAAGCDAGPNRDQPPGVSGIPLADVHLVGANVGPDQPLPVNGSIELQFDRILLPAAITRQTFSLQGVGGNTILTPTVTYDPVSRVVTIAPMPNAAPMLAAGQSYQLVINPPGSASDVNGVRAFDGATLAGGKPIVV